MTVGEAAPGARHIALIVEAAGDGGDIAGLLLAAGYRVSVLAADADLTANLLRLAPEAAFMALGRSRGGRLAGVLETLRIPYTHTGVLGSALAANRHQAKIVLRAAGLPVTDHVVAARAEAAHTHQMQPPYVVKPVEAGAGVGLVVVRSEREPPPAVLLEAAWAASEAVMIERFVPGRTLGVAVMGDVALGVSEVVSAAPAPAGAGPTPKMREEVVTPAEISPNIYEKLQKMSLKAHDVIGCRGVTRISFRWDGRASGDTGLVLLDVDTQPALAATALLPEQARFAGHSLADLVVWMVEDASCNR